MSIRLDADSKKITRTIQDDAIAIIRQHPNGAPVRLILAELKKRNPKLNANTVSTQVSDLPKNRPGEVVRVERGVLQLTSAVAAEKRSANLDAVAQQSESATSAELEKKLYEPVASWLQNVVEEATAAHAIGGKVFKTKWGTPDVVGVYRPHSADIVKFDAEIISVEVKIDTSQSIVAFGQAIAYRLFSTKVYLVVPDTTPEDDLTRLESLGLLFGVGLVVFSKSTNDPEFSTRLRAQRFNPDMYYVNEFARRLHDSNEQVFRQLFG